MINNTVFLDQSDTEPDLIGNNTCASEIVKCETKVPLKDVRERVTGSDYGKKFTGTVNHKEPNWENGSFKRSEGTHLDITLDTPINHFGLRETLWLCAWVNKKQFHWGQCEVVG